MTTGTTTVVVAIEAVGFRAGEGGMSGGEAVGGGCGVGEGIDGGGGEALARAEVAMALVGMVGVVRRVRGRDRRFGRRAWW